MHSLILASNGSLSRVHFLGPEDRSNLMVNQEVNDEYHLSSSGLCGFISACVMAHLR